MLDVQCQQFCKVRHLSVIGGPHLGPMWHKNQPAMESFTVSQVPMQLLQHIPHSLTKHGTTSANQRSSRSQTPALGPDAREETRANTQSRKHVHGVCMQKERSVSDC